MPAETVKRPLWNNQTCWLLSRKDGAIKVVFGSDPLETTDDDLGLVQDPQDPTKVRVAANPIEAIRDFITLRPDQFAILTNPAKAVDSDYPNGSWGRGRKELTTLNYGTKRVIASGHFPLWPGQAVEIKDVYRLLPKDYLIVQVVSDVDASAPYYDVTVRCAADIAAVVDEVNEQPSGENAQNGAPPVGPSAAPAEPPKTVFKAGQRIRISGTPTYIPPTGIEVLKEEGTGKEIRQAVELGPTEFCCLLDREGKLQPKPGPGRVFPGPYDVVQTKGSSRNGVYDAYHLRADRGILVRVVAATITKAELEEQLPRGVVLEQEMYQKGDEIFIKEVSAYLVPGNAIEVVDPETRLPHVGNDHDKIFVSAIGVDQKSGIYVADVKTGNVDLARGEKSEVLDPRFKKHITRKVPASLWNLVVGHGEPHKLIPERGPDGREALVETPWALSVTVPNNEAVLITSRSGRRPVIGPKMELLEYDETLQVLGLSKGRPKTDACILKTSFLRIDGNNVSDTITLQTEDYATVEVEVSYGVRFVGESDAERAAWFAYTNYVQFFCDHLRSILRAEARKLTLTELIKNVAEFVRDTVLGTKPEEGHRPGRKFPENNMLVHEVEVLNWVISDEKIAGKIEMINRSVVTRQLEDADKRNELDSRRQQDEVDAAIKKLLQDMVDRDRQLRLAQTEADNAVEVRKQELTSALNERRHKDGMVLDQQKADLADALKQRELSRMKSEADLRDAIARANNETEEAHANATSAIELAELKAAAEADVERFKAVNPELVAALTALGQSIVTGELARNLPQASGGSLNMLLGAGGAKALLQWAAGTPYEGVLKALDAGNVASGSNARK